MIKNGKFFLQPPKDVSDFKDIFRRAAAAGAGRPITKDGFPAGSWTPELLAEAISLIDANHVGIDLRTVQLWFQENEKGISTANIRWLARVLGCDDPVATSEWQMVLSEAQLRLTSKRKERKKVEVQLSEIIPIKDNEEIKIDPPYAIDEKLINGSIASKIGLGITNKTEIILGGKEPMNFLVVMWAIYAFIGLINFILEVGSVTYSPYSGLNKQIGFIWAPTWNILPLIIIPLYILHVNKLLNYWKSDGRVGFNHDSSNTWAKKIESFSFSFVSIIIISVFLVFGAQWFGVYIRLYFTGSPRDFQIDRNLLTLIRPDIISIGGSIIISGLGYLYTALYIGIYLLGLLLMYIVLVDFNELSLGINRNQEVSLFSERQNKITMLRDSVFRCTILGLWIAMCIKLQVVYLASDSVNIVAWLIEDFCKFVGIYDRSNVWIDQVSMSHFTTLLMVFLTVTVFLMCLMILYQSDKYIYDTVGIDQDASSNASMLIDRYFLSVRAYLSMIVFVMVLALTILLIGKFIGFTVLLFISIVISLYFGYNPPYRTQEAV